jgi:putative endopeptidase
MSDVNNVFVYPELLFVDNVEGAQYYQDTDDPIVEQANKQFLYASMIPVMADLSWLGMTQDEAISAVQNICSFEKSYAKDAGSSSLYVNKKYGAFAAASENLSLDELAALCPNFPVKQTVKKFGKGNSPFYSVLSKKWMETFNTLWTDDNLDELKLVIKAKILQECEPYLDPSVQNQIKAMLGKPEIDAQSNAVNVICQNKTFAQLVSKIYVADNYSDEDTARLTDITKKLTESLKGLIDKTAWMSDSTKEQMRLKLDELNINILVPEGGYIDFSDLTLTPSEEGGSLVENYLTLKAYVDAKINERIGQPAVARMLWEHNSPAVINCCYDQDTNSVNILPGFLATDMYRSDMSEEELFGSMGWVIAHEISHGFDFAGSQFDAYGRGNILFGDDLKDYMAKVDQIVAYYDTIEPLKDVYVTGDTVKVEAAADLIGMQILMETVKEEKGFQYEPFFKQTAVDYCQVVPSVDVIQMLMGGDIHPLNYVRTNVNAQMFDEFYQTFDVKEGDGMYLPAEQRIKIFGE